MKVEQGKSIFWLLLEIPIGINTSIKSFRRDLFINIVLDNLNRIKIYSCFAFIPKTGVGLSKTGVYFFFYPRGVKV